jgi:hypothetical protein
MVVGLDALLDNLSVTFSLWNVFLRICKVHLDSKFSEQCILEWSKLVIALDFHYMESGFVVDLKNLFESFSVVGHCLLVYELCSSVEFFLEMVIGKVSSLTLIPSMQMMILSCFVNSS